MSEHVWILILFYGGELILYDEFAPNYIGGRCRPLQVTRLSKFSHYNTKSSMLWNLILRGVVSRSLTCRFVVGEGFIEMPIEAMKLQTMFYKRLQSWGWCYNWTKLCSHSTWVFRWTLHYGTLDFFEFSSSYLMNFQTYRYVVPSS